MGVLNPVYALVIPSLVFITIPLAVLAGITTTLAFSVLIVRVLAVYLDIVISLIPQSLSGTTPAGAASSSSPMYRRLNGLKTPSSPTSPSASSQQTPRALRHHRRRRSSASAISGGGSASSVSERGLGLIPSVGAERDFEGIGGWRVGRDEDQDDVAWTTVNPPPPERSPLIHLPRHHARSASGRPTTPGEGGPYLMMKSGRTRSPETRPSKRASPNSSRARTPTGPRLSFAPLGQPDGYFALSTGASAPSASASPKAVRKVPSSHPVE